MSTIDEFRARSRAMWAAGDWDSFSRTIAPVGALVMERSGIEPGMKVLDVGTGSGGNVAIPAALRGADVVGSDLTPELFEHARRRAADAGVEVEWVEADAMDLPFDDGRFDRVLSTFGAMFAPDHARAAAELVRVCAVGGQVIMTTWQTDGFAGELFKLTAKYMPPPPSGVEPPPLWGVPDHINEVFGAAGAKPAIAPETVSFEFGSPEEMVELYENKFGLFVAARGLLEPQGRWEPFIGEFGDLVRRFNRATDGTTRVESAYFVITIDR